MSQMHRKTPLQLLFKRQNNDRKFIKGKSFLPKKSTVTTLLIRKFKCNFRKTFKLLEVIFLDYHRV